MSQVWTTCPDCGWDYGQHGDTHMSTRFNCARSRNSVIHDAVGEPVIGKVGVVVSAAEADAWHEEIKGIMASREINFGDAVDYYIRRKAGQQSAKDYVAPGWDAA